VKTLREKSDEDRPWIMVAFLSSALKCWTIPQGHDTVWERQPLEQICAEGARLQSLLICLLEA